MMVTAAGLREGDVIDLEGVDDHPDNRECWHFENARVESVSTLAEPGGGWADGSLTADIAIIYTENGAVPAVVPLGSLFELLNPDPTLAVDDD